MPDVGTLTVIPTNTSVEVIPVYVAKFEVNDPPLWVWL